MLGIKKKCQLATQMKTLEITLENCKKLPLKHFTETPIFA